MRGLARPAARGWLHRCGESGPWAGSGVPRLRVPADPPVAPQSLLSPVAFGFGCESLALLEERGEGAQWHNVGAAPAADVFSLAQVSGLLLLDTALYGLTTWYLEAVCPGGPQE